MRSPIVRKLSSLIVAAGALCAGVAVPAIASAAPQGNIVYLGDSFTANPDQGRMIMRYFDPAAAFNNYPSTRGCLQAPNNAPRSVQAITGRSVADYSCTAQTSRTALGRVHDAISTGDLHAGTRSVVLAVGMNNYGPYGAGIANILDPNSVKATYTRDMVEIARLVRNVAPNAKIIIPGQVSIAGPGDMVCSVNVIPNQPAGFPVPPVTVAENHNRSMQMDVARKIGATFLDLKSESAAHHTCAADSQRWVAGAIDNAPHTLSYHPTFAGMDFVARRVASVA